MRRRVLSAALLLGALAFGRSASGAAAGAVMGSDAAVTYIPADSVAAGFARGSVLVNQDNYMIHASRRTAPGMVEIHAKDTDLIYMLEGEATFVTGGTLIDGKPTAPDEVRGTQLEGGDTRRLVKGDVIVVPNGVCHWFKEIKGPVLYYVVKVRRGGAR